MRRYRERLRNGLRCIVIQLRETEIEVREGAAMIQGASSRCFMRTSLVHWAEACDAQRAACAVKPPEFFPEHLQDKFAVGRLAMDSQMQMSHMPPCLALALCQLTC